MSSAIEARNEGAVETIDDPQCGDADRPFVLQPLGGFDIGACGLVGRQA